MLRHFPVALACLAAASCGSISTNARKSSERLPQANDPVTGGGSLAAIIAGLLVAVRRWRAEDPQPVATAATSDPDPVPEPDPEQRLADALAGSRHGRTRPAATGVTVPLWVQRLDPDAPPQLSSGAYPVSDERG